MTPDKQSTAVILRFIDATPLGAISPTRATPIQRDAAKEAREAACGAATTRAVAHGDVGISTPSDGKSFIAETPEEREAYQPAGTIAAAESAQGI